MFINILYLIGFGIMAPILTFGLLALTAGYASGMCSHSEVTDAIILRNYQLDWMDCASKWYIY